MVHIFKTILNTFTSIHHVLSFTTDVIFIFYLWMDITAVRTRDIMQLQAYHYLVVVTHHCVIL